MSEDARTAHKRKADLKDFIIEEIERTGFTLERYTANLLTKKGWDVYPSAHFHDRDLNKDRELDIYAQKELYLFDGALVLKFELLIECKKIPGNAWIFFPGPVQRGIKFLLGPNMYTILNGLDLTFDGPIPLEFLFSNHSRGFFSSGYSEVILDEKLSNKNSNNIFQALTKIIKAASEQKEMYLNSIAGEIEDLKGGNVLQWVGEGSPMTITYVFPIVVFQGKMFSAKFPLNRENLNETGLVNYYGEYMSANYTKHSDIDVVEKQYLETYLQELSDDIRAIRKAAIKDDKAVMKRISEIIIENVKSSRKSTEHSKESQQRDTN